MRILDIREKAIELKLNMRNAVFSFDTMTTSIVAVLTDVVRDGKPVVGYAFNSTGRYACGAQMRERFIPRILQKDPDELIDEERGNFDPAVIIKSMMVGEKPGGDMERSVGIGTIETAIWDAMAKIEEKPLYKLIAERCNPNPVDSTIFCYVGGGWYHPGQTVDDLKDEMKKHLDEGYTLVKTKVGGLPLDQDLDRIDAILSILDGGHQLAVDANCGLSSERALSYAEALKPYNLKWFEEPVHPIDFEGLSQFVSAYENPVATGENLFSQEELRNLLRHGGFRSDLDYVQIDVPQSYGIQNCAESIDIMGQFGWKPDRLVPHGGNQMSLAVALGFGMKICESYPHVFGVFSGYADNARVENGYMPAPTLPGIGFEGQNDLFALFKSIMD